MIEEKLTIDKLETEIFYLRGTEALVRMGKIVEGINATYPIHQVLTNPKKMEKRQESMYNALKKLYEEYLRQK